MSPLSLALPGATRRKRRRQLVGCVNWFRSLRRVAFPPAVTHRRHTQQRQSHPLSTQQQPLITSPTHLPFLSLPHICRLAPPEQRILLATPPKPPHHPHRTLPLSRGSAATRTRTSDSSDADGDTASTSWVASAVAAVSDHARGLRAGRLLMALHSRWTEKEELVRAALA